MKSKSILILGLGLLLFSISCGQSKQNKETGDVKSISKAIDACEWLSKDDVESFLGTEVGECKVLVHYVSEDGRDAASQVAYYSETGPDKHVGLLIKRTSVNASPSSRIAYADQSKSEDTMGAGNEMYEAVMQGKDIQGLGEVAFTYEMFGHNLIVFWKGRYQMIITIYGQDNEKNIDFQKKIASKIINGL
jgi:hypothetical protein